jgi:hypothetical protein
MAYSESLRLPNQGDIEAHKAGCADDWLTAEMIDAGLNYIDESARLGEVVDSIGRPLAPRCGCRRGYRSRREGFS